MKIWKNTNTLDGYDENLNYTDDKQKAEVLLMGSKSVNLNEFPNLKGIFRAGIGKENVPIREAKNRGVIVRFPSKNTINYIYEETANFTCNLIFRMNYQNVGTLNPWKKFDRRQLNDKTLLLIGTGNIGGKIVDKMNKFLKVNTYDILYNSVSELDEFIGLADFISLHIPNNPENLSFFNAKKLGSMKKGSVLINTARGAIVNEDDLYTELSKGRIRAAFDVFWKEPYSGRLTEFYPDPFYMTPHIASTCIGFLKGCYHDLYKLTKEL